MKKLKNMELVPKLKKRNSGTGSEINNIGFTLVELIVVITILAILATIGFVSFSGYLAGTRDTNRISQLKAMSDALELYTTKKDLPLPDDKVDINVGSTLLGYQGDIGKNVLETIGYTESGLDPKYKEYFSYYLTKDKKKFQLLSFLEEPNTDVLAFNNNVKATDYSDKFPFVKGKKLGIILDENNTPVQKNSNITASGYLDIVNTDNIYNIVFSNESTLSGTGKTLKGSVGLSGLVGYWSFDEIVNGSFIDYSENKAVGTISGGVSLGTGQSGSGAVFDGEDGEFYVDLIKNIGGNSSSPHTISAWIKPNSIPICEDSSCRQWLLLLGNKNSNDTYFPGTHHWLIGGEHGGTQFGIWSGEQRSPNLKPLIWQNVISTFDGSTLKVYLNGNLITNNSGEKNHNDMNIKDSSLSIGKKMLGESFYHGGIDELRIYNRELSEKEVKLIYDLDK